MIPGDQSQIGALKYVSFKEEEIFEVEQSRVRGEGGHHDDATMLNMQQDFYGVSS